MEFADKYNRRKAVKMNRKDANIQPPPEPPARKFVGAFGGYETQQSVMERLEWIKASKEWSEKHENRSKV